MAIAIIGIDEMVALSMWITTNLRPAALDRPRGLEGLVRYNTDDMNLSWNEVRDRARRFSKAVRPV